MTQPEPDNPNSQFDVSTFIDASGDAIIGKSLDNVIRSWNRGAERIYGYSTDEAIGKPMSLILPADRLNEPEAIIERIKRGERVEDFETVRVAKDGSRIDVSLTVWPARDVEGSIVGAFTIGRNVSKQQRAERDLQALQQTVVNRALIMDTANRVALDILASRTGTEALHHIAEAARALSKARYAALGVARPDGRGLIEFVTAGLTFEEEAGIGSRPVGVGILGLLLNRTEPLRLDTLSQHPQSAGFPPNHPPMDSFLGVPIRRGDTVLGSLYLTNKEGGDVFTEIDEAAVLALGSHAAIAIHNLHLLTRQRALISGLIAAQEEERRAVAYDLHDGLTQYVMASHAHLEAFRRAHETGKDERAGRELEQGIRYLKEAVVESRRMVNGLRTLALDDLGLAGALEQLITEEKTRAGWQNAEFVHNIAGQRFHKTLETTAYRVAQEALTNARKHAQTDRVRLSVLADYSEPEGTGRITMEIRDWGRGFDAENRSADYVHVGLQSMYERVSLLGGTYSLKAKVGEGAVVRAVLPALGTQDHDEEP